MSFYTTITNFLNDYQYLAIFLLIYIAELGVSLPIPFPSEITFIIIGYEIYLHKLDLFLSVGVGIIADYLGSFSLFLVLYYLSNLKIVRKLTFKVTQTESYKNIKENISEGSFWFVVVGRLIPYARYYITITCALIGIAPRKIAGLFSISSIIWATGLIILGVKLGPIFSKVQDYVAESGNINIMLEIVVPIILIIIIFQLGKRTIRTRK